MNVFAKTLTDNRINITVQNDEEYLKMLLEVQNLITASRTEVIKMEVKGGEQLQ